VRTARLDLDDDNNDTEDGLHITSMAGTWMAVVKGFGGMRVREGKLYLNPFLPTNWTSYAFHILFKGTQLKVEVTPGGSEVTRQNGEPVSIQLGEKELTV